MFCREITPCWQRQPPQTTLLPASCPPWWWWAGILMGAPDTQLPNCHYESPFENQVEKSVSHPCICYLACYVMLCLLWVNQVKCTSLILVTLVSGDPASIPALGDLWPAHLANYYHSPQHNWKLKETLQSDAALPVLVVVVQGSA